MIFIFRIFTNDSFAGALNSSSLIELIGKDSWEAVHSQEVGFAHSSCGYGARIMCYTAKINDNDNTSLALKEYTGDWGKQTSVW